MLAILDLIQQDVALHRVSTRDGGEFAGPCPLCGGTDRFHVWPYSARKVKFWCRSSGNGCSLSGDELTYLMRVRGLSFREAARIAGKDLPLAPMRPSPTQRALAQTRAAYQHWEQTLLDRITRDYWDAWERTETIELQMALLLCQRAAGTAVEWEQWQSAFDRAQQDAWAALRTLDFFQQPATMGERVSLWAEGAPR